MDAYVVGEFEPIKSFEGIVIAVVLREDDDDPKLVITKSRVKYTDEQIMALVEFQERFFKSRIVRS